MSELTREQLEATLTLHDWRAALDSEKGIPSAHRHVNFYRPGYPILWYAGGSIHAGRAYVDDATDVWEHVELPLAKVPVDTFEALTGRVIEKGWL